MNDQERKQMDEEMRQQAQEVGLGATGERPLGSMIPGDEGELKVAVGSKNGKIVINFGKPIAWVGMQPFEAIALAQVLQERARELLKDRE